jgi:hypothetical protein
MRNLMASKPAVLLVWLLVSQSIGLPPIALIRCNLLWTFLDFMDAKIRVWTFLSFMDRC